MMDYVIINSLHHAQILDVGIRNSSYSESNHAIVLCKVKMKFDKYNEKMSW